MFCLRIAFYPAEPHGAISLFHQMETQIFHNSGTDPCLLNGSLRHKKSDIRRRPLRIIGNEIQLGDERLSPEKSHLVHIIGEFSRRKRHKI